MSTQVSTQVHTEASAQGSERLQGIVVSHEEAGQKLMGFLERRLLLPTPLLHRWIRTGQIRLNGSRTQPFVRINAGDSVRVPPFAGSMSQQAHATRQRQERQKAHAAAATASSPRSAQEHYQAAKRPQTASHAAPGQVQDGVEILAENDEYLIVLKPAGLPTQPGTGHTDALTTRLQILRKGAFTPTPVHRMDRDTSGVLLVAKTFNALRKAHEALRNRQGLGKEYLVWVHGIWQGQGDRLVQSYMRKGLVGSQERMLVSDSPADGAREAMLVARPLGYAKNATLLQIRLLTGRTHQIRAQLAHLGYAVIGDGKYGKRSAGEPLYLHALRLTLPNGKSYQALPRWQGPFAVDTLPAPMAEEEIRRAFPARHNERPIL